MIENSPTKIYIKELDPDIIEPRNSNYMNHDQGSSKLVICGKPGCFTRGTGVLMYDGKIKNVEDVELGEKVMGDDSTPRNVLELCRNSDEMFRINPKKGESYTVNRLHKLVLVSTGYNQIKKGSIVEITVEDYLKKSKTWKERWKIYRAGVNFMEKQVKIDPYIVGVWLGDGTSAEPEFTNIDSEVLDYLSKFSTENNLIFKKKSENSEYTYRISSIEGTKGKNTLLNNLKRYNLINNKHIPDDYKINSRENRLQLLAGLLDTDGSYDENGSGYDFIQKNERLFDDAIFLARSLGFSAYKKKTKKSCMYKGERKEGTYFRCHISGNVDEIPCKILRKQAKHRKINKNNLVTGFSVESVGEGDYFGFTLDGNHRFLLGTFDVVRNTGKTTLIASLLYAKKHIFPCGIFFSGTEDSNDFYKKLAPDSFVFSKYDETQLESFVKRQKLAKKFIPNYAWSVCLLDDCTDNPSLFTKPLQLGLYKNGRHYKMLYLVSLQYCLDIKPVIRTNVDGTFILRETNLRNRKSLWENYAGIVPDFTMFCDILDQINDDYTALYIHNNTTSTKMEDCLFWYKAKPIPKDWKFGAPEYWEHHYARFNPDYVPTV